jgi:hypothetical protein
MILKVFDIEARKATAYEDLSYTVALRALYIAENKLLGGGGGG